MSKPKRGLGKGLEALFQDNETDELSIRTLNINDIEPHKGQPRQEFDEEKIAELCASIKEHGVLSPILVRPMPSGRYQIVAGERRWRASRMAGLTEVPVVIRELTDENAYELSLVENLIREDLNPVEEALGYKNLADTFDMTQEIIAERVGKSRSAVANSMRLLSLPEDVIESLRENKLSAGHARALLPLEKGKASETAEKIIAEKLSVRETEKLVKELLKPKGKEKKESAPTFYKEMELALKDHLKRGVKVAYKGKGKGKITIEFYSEDELRDLGHRLCEEQI